MFFVPWGFHNKNNVIYDFLRWPMLNEAVYPFYILQQTIMILIAFFMMDQQWGFFPKAFLMVSGTFAGSMLLYEYFIRRINFIRPLFGLKSPVKTKEKIEQ